MMINLEKEIFEQPAVLSAVYDANKDALSALASAIKEQGIDNIYFVARGTSDHACIYAQYLFQIVAGIPCTLGTPSVFTKYKSNVKFNRTLVLGVSQSGRAEDVMSVLRYANENGVLTAAITNNLESPMATAAKFHLYCNAGEEKSIAATKTFTSQVYLLALLCGLVADDQEFLDELSQVPAGISRLFEESIPQIKNIANDTQDITGAVVLGRGMVYPIALEGALKILETNKYKMRGYPVSDFYHGPVAQLSKDDVAFVLAASGPVFDDALAMLDKLDSVGARSIVITDDKELSEKRASILIPKLKSDLTSPFLFAVVMQLLAANLTIVRNIDPDRSDVIRKVTITK
ncbi:MAG: SIS domain-containing protein [Clostridia bacterium]|nr:SIS domain-containing protein [Clostridia bacterium]